MTFARKTPPRVRSYPSAIPESQRRNAVFARMDAPAAPPIVKDAPVRSEAYRRAVASLPCIFCGRVGHSQHAHTNAGKAKGMKNDDRDAMPLCADEPGRIGCHRRFDTYELLVDRAEHRTRGAQWASETRAQIETLGLWPANLPRWPE